MTELQSLTVLENPNSVQQMKGWLSEHGFNSESLGKKDVQELMKTAPSKSILQCRLSLVLITGREALFSFTVQAAAVFSQGGAK